MNLSTRRFSVAILLLLIASAGLCSDQKYDGYFPISEFTNAAPVDGRYGPNPKVGWFAGEFVVIKGLTFRYGRFTDVVGVPEPDYSGPLLISKDHIFLNHPGVPYPYRIAGRADGVPVLMTWEGFENWKKSRKVSDLDILFLEIPEKEQPKKAGAANAG